jgi:carboxylate-amine ligase
MTQYRFGIEEEYFVINLVTGNVVSELSAEFMRTAEKKLGSKLMNELLQSQIEVATSPCVTPREARQELLHFRRTLAEVGQSYGLGIVAAGSHPLSRPSQHKATNKRRYARIIDELGLVGLGNALCALHVHVEVPDPDCRVEIMHRLIPFLPMLLALSTSSPFWDGMESGLLGYRNAANDASPRSGFPEMFRTSGEYEAYVQALTDANIIPDASYIWWAVRPSLRHPTLELRLTDCCTSVDDAVAIASLYRALVRRCVEDPRLNSEFSSLTRALTEENRWRAQRYGTEGTYIDVDSRQAKLFRQIMDEMLALVKPDLIALDLEGELPHLMRIIERGTSAHHQIGVFRSLRRAGIPRVPALRQLSLWLQQSTAAGDFIPRPAPVSASTLPKFTLEPILTQ